MEPDLLTVSLIELVKFELYILIAHYENALG